MNKNLLTALAIMLVPLSAAGADEDITQARAAAMQLGKSLKMTLQTALKSDGPAAAVTACNLSAPEIAKTVSADTGWSVGRTSLKERNPLNKPDAWELKVLHDFEMRKADGEDAKKLEYSETVTLDGHKTFRYMKAIPTAQVCTNCHGGANVSAEVESRLKELYPYDRARGFKPGDLRGAFTLSKKLD